MSCELVRQKLDVYVDAELPESEASEVQSHLRHCPSCAADALARSQLKRSVHLAGQAFAPGAELRSRVESRVLGRTHVRRWAWLPQIGLAVAALVIVVAGSLLWLRHRQSQQLLGELTDLHVATLASSNRVDVASSDRHTVKPWFQGKVPFTFNLPELQGTPFTLIGGRMTYLDQAPGAELLFMVRKHVLSVFIFKNSPDLDRALRSSVTTRMLSFNIESWADNGLRYVLVTDAARADADELRARFAAAAQ